MERKVCFDVSVFEILKFHVLEAGIFLEVWEEKKITDKILISKIKRSHQTN